MENGLKPPDNFDFPFTPYPIQYNFMKNLYIALENKKLGIFESPTGTGKTLSIICGALRWLKDHNENVRNKLADDIHRLELEKQKLAADSFDWFNSQSKEIEVTRQLAKLKLEYNSIKQYDESIAKLMKKKKKIESKQKVWKKASVATKEEKSVNLDSNNDEDNEGDEDILLEDDTKTNYEEEELEEEEEDNNKYHPVKIIICSRTHSQLSQFVGEITKSPFENVRVISLASRQTYCINSSVTKFKNMSLINEKCLDMQKQSSKVTKVDADGKKLKRHKGALSRCPYYKQTTIEELADQALLEVQDIEDLVMTGKDLKACPYYASRKAVENAEVILVPYNTLLHKATREANGLNLKNSVIIIDEAHNLLESLVQMYSAELNYEQLYHCWQQMENYKKKYSTRFSPFNLLCINQLLFIISKLIKLFDNERKGDENKTQIYTIENFVSKAEIDNYNFYKLIKFARTSKIAQKLHSFANRQDFNFSEKPVKKGVKEFLSSIENKQKACADEKTAQNQQQQKNSTPSNPLLTILSFLESLTYAYEDGRILLHISDNKKEAKIKFLLLNPASQFRNLVENARSIIVAGGTMKPIEEFRERLFLSAGAEKNRIVEFSCDHIIPPQNILPIIMTTSANKEGLIFNYTNRLLMGNNLKNIIREACDKIKGGIVVFFPSYNYENWFWQQLKDTVFNRQIFREPQESGTVDSVLKSYAEAIKKPLSRGALMFSVVGGKLSEGLNFSDDLGRCIIVVGLPYANIKAVDLKEKMDYLNKKEGSSAGQRFYEGLCMKAVNQCIGRAVRHKDDYATVLLLDERYNRSSTKNALPEWIKRSLKVCDFKESFQLIKEFFQEKTNAL